MFYNTKVDDVRVSTSFCSVLAHLSQLEGPTGLQGALPKEDELYVLAESRDRIHKERAMFEFGSKIVPTQDSPK